MTISNHTQISTTLTDVIQKAEDARQAVLDLELPKTATETMLVAIARHTFPSRPEKWTFHMLQPQQVLTVWDAIRALPGKDRPHQVRHLFDLVLTHLEWDTGLVILTREELAERIGTTPGTVSRMMGTLERIGVIIRSLTATERAQAADAGASDGLSDGVLQRALCRILEVSAADFDQHILIITMLIYALAMVRGRETDAGDHNDRLYGARDSSSSQQI